MEFSNKEKILISAILGTMNKNEVLELVQRSKSIDLFCKLELEREVLEHDLHFDIFKKIRKDLLNG